MKKREKVWSPWLLCWPLGLIVYLTAKSSPDIAENVYARAIYRGYAEVATFISRRTDRSMAEVLLIVTAAAFVLFVLRRIYLMFSHPFENAILLVRNILIFGGIVFLWYMIGCGTNYYRYEYATLAELEVRESTTEELYGLCTDLHEKAEAARTRLKIKKGEEYAITRDLDDLAYEAAKAMYNFALGKDYMRQSSQPAKQVHFSRVMSEFNITGVYFPWTCEANINVDQPDYSIGATMGHELAHVQGFMREDEAGFIGFSACTASDDPDLVYSAYADALIRAGNRLAEDSPKLYAELVSQYSEGLILDFKGGNLYWDQFRDTTLSEVGEKVNDTYLKANAQEKGTKSYGGMVDLLLAQYRKDNGK